MSLSYVCFKAVVHAGITANHTCMAFLINWGSEPQIMISYIYTVWPEILAGRIFGGLL